MKTGVALMLAWLLVGCASQPMAEPLDATSELALQASLSSLKERVNTEQYQRTTSAIGILMVTHLEFPERQRFLQEVIDGQSPLELIAASRPAAERYRIE